MVDVPSDDSIVAWLGGDPTDGVPDDDGALLLQGDHADGSRWFLYRLDGWFGGAASTVNPVQRGRGYGAFGGNRAYAPLPVTIEGEIHCTSRAQARAIRDGLTRRIQLYDRALTVREYPEAHERFRYIIRSGQPIIDYETDTLLSYSIPLTCLDSRMMAGQQIVGQVGAFGGAKSGGLYTPPIDTTPNLSEAAIAAAADLTWKPDSFDGWDIWGGQRMTNPGTADGPLTALVKGPIVGLRIVLMATGRTLALDDLVLDGNQTLIIDMENNVVVRNDGTSQAGTVGPARGWMPFRAGVQEYGIWTQARSLASACTLTGTPAWL